MIIIIWLILITLVVSYLFIINLGVMALINEFKKKSEKLEDLMDLQYYIIVNKFKITDKQLNKFVKEWKIYNSNDLPKNIPDNYVQFKGEK